MRDDGVFVLDQASEALTFEGLAARPVASVLRGFSAPVHLALDLSDDDLLTLLRHDPDPLNRWQSGRSVAERVLVRAVTGERPSGAAEALASVLDGLLDAEARRYPAFVALLLDVASETEIAQLIGRDVDPARIHAVRDSHRVTLGRALADRLSALRDELGQAGLDRIDATAAGVRAFRNAALGLLAAADPAVGGALAQAQFDASATMTDRLAALTALSRIPGAAREAALAVFADRFRDEPLALDKWFAIQATIAEDDVLVRVERLARHPAVATGNPNRVRALVGGFAFGNPTGFHRPDGRGYAFVADWIRRLDAANPQVAARLATAFAPWRMVEAGRRARAQVTLEGLAAAPLSPDTADIIARTLGNAR